VLKLNRLISASALLLGVALLVPKAAKATESMPETKTGIQYLIPGTADFYCRMEICCYGWIDCLLGPNSCCGVS
jgi:hypothetical protein